MSEQPDTPYMTVAWRQMDPESPDPSYTAQRATCTLDGGQWQEPDGHCVYATRRAWERSRLARLDRWREQNEPRALAQAKGQER